MTIGVIGQGYVGTAIKLGFQDHYKVVTYDRENQHIVKYQT